MERADTNETVKELKLKAPWGHIAAKAHGSKEHPLVLMVHGILDNAGTFDRLLTLLPRDHYYVCIDLPGHGHSSPFAPGVPLHFLDYVHSVNVALDALGCDKCTAIGHSFGGQLLSYCCALFPGRIRRLILLDGVMSAGVDNQSLVGHLQERYNLASYDFETGQLYTKEEVLYALRYKRLFSLTMDAAEALFPRSVTKVGDLYKYNRDPRLRLVVRPILNPEQQRIIFNGVATPMLLIIPSSGFLMNRYIVERIRRERSDLTTFQIRKVNGNHDVHNNNPERVASHICQYMENNDTPYSKL